MNGPVTGQAGDRAPCSPQPLTLSLTYNDLDERRRRTGNPNKKGSDDVTRQNNRQAGEYPKATQQSTALRLLGERTRMSLH